MSDVKSLVLGRGDRVLVALLVAGALVTGAACVSGPDYRPEPVEAGRGWTSDVVSGEEPLRDAWWTTLDDPVLTQLVELALEQNLDVRQAVARVAQARALRDAAAGGRMPRVDAGASVTRREQSVNGPLPVDRIPGLDRSQTIYEAGFDAAWELDLFGRVRRSVEAATAQLQAGMEDERAARISVAAEVARRYVEVRGLDRMIASREDAVEASRRTLELVRAQQRAGEVAASAVVRAEAELAAQEAELPGLRGSRRAAALSIGILLGETPESGLHLLEVDEKGSPGGAARIPHTDQAAGAGGGLRSAEVWGVTLEPVPVGRRADVLRRRPDVRAAERRLAAETARIGVATAELFPRLTITAAGGFQSLDVGDLLESGSRTWSVAPFLSWRIFDGGRVRAEIRAAEAKTEEAAHAYAEAVLRALTDAEVALTRYQHDLDAVERRRAAREAARRSREFVATRYEAGDVSLLVLLDADRRLSDAEFAYASMRTQATVDLVALYKALGTTP